MGNFNPESKKSRPNPLIEFIQTLENAAVNPIIKKAGSAKGGIIGLEFHYQTNAEKESAKKNVLFKYPGVKILNESDTALTVQTNLVGLSSNDSEEMGRKYDWMRW